MKRVIEIINTFSRNSREKRASVFRNNFLIDEKTKILDLGSETGSNISAVLKGTHFRPQNVYIADIDSARIKKGEKAYGFVPVLINESEPLPFNDGFFDIVYCSSVIEHVTVEKKQVWSLNSDKEFRDRSLKKQIAFANEIRRLGKQYFVQTPNRLFPIESHTWLPFIAYLPRKVLILMIKLINKFWIKQTKPDWNLLSHSELSNLFREAHIISEKFFGLTKSFIVIKNHD